MPETPHLSAPFAELAKLCPSCGGKLPCPLHDAKLREAILAPPERDVLPWEKLERREIADVGQNILSLFPLPGGLLLAAQQNGNISMCDPSAKAWDRVHLKADFVGVPDLFPLDGGRFLVSVGGTLYLLNALQNERVATLLSPEDHRNITTLAPVGDGTYVAGAADGDVLLFNPTGRDGERFKHFARADTAAPIDVIAPMGGQQFLMGNNDGVLATLDLTQRDRSKRVHDIAYAEAGFQAFHRLRNEVILIVHDDGRLTLSDASRLKHERMRDFGHCGAKVQAVAPFGEDTLLVGCQDGRIRLVDPTKPEGERVRIVAEYRAEGRNPRSFPPVIASIIPTSDHSFVVGGYEGKIVEFAIPDSVLTAQHERKLQGPKIPPMPDV